MLKRYSRRLLKRFLLRIGIYYKVNEYRRPKTGPGPSRDVSQRHFYSTLINSDDVVFDVGANVGQRAEIFSQLSKQVIAVEPQTECIKHLKSRFLYRRNVIIENIALGEKEGEGVIYESDLTVLSSMSAKFIRAVKTERFRGNVWAREASVQIWTLDKLIEIYGLPRFIKIDVEGYEINVLKGLRQAVPYLSFEFVPELIDETDKCVRRINEISGDYYFNYCLGEDLSFILPKHADCKSFLNEVLPALGRQTTFGDIYAIHQSGQRPEYVN